MEQDQLLRAERNVSVKKSGVIQELSVIDWRKELNVWGHYAALQKKIAAGDFRMVRSYMDNGVSEEVYQAFRELTENVMMNDWDWEQKMRNVIAWLNYKAGQCDRISFPYQDEIVRSWMRINGSHVINIEFINEYTRLDLDVLYIDKEGDDAFWISVANELLKAAKGEFEGVDDYCSEEWLN